MKLRKILRQGDIMYSSEYLQRRDARVREFIEGNSVYVWYPRKSGKTRTIQRMLMGGEL